MADENPVGAITGAIKKKKDEKHRKRDPRSWDNIKRNLQNMSEEDKWEYLAERYNDIYTENRSLSTNLATKEKQLTNLQKDTDRDRAELTKAILAKGHLESLCRELQKQNKAIKEENVARIKEEEDRRREVANTFTERLNALTNLITESKDKSNKVKEENQSMTDKLTELYEQYQQRENHLETVTKQLDLQKKLAETQAKKKDIEYEAERQTLLAQKKTIEMQLEQYEREIMLTQEKNRSLEAQVDLYKSQYSDFENTMTKSNKVFDTFKEEMSRMNKQLITLEAERNDLRSRWQSSVNSLIVLSEQHMALANEQSALEKKLAMLQKLCRQLQEDRSAFLKQLKENNIEPKAPSLVENTEMVVGVFKDQNSDLSLESQSWQTTQHTLKLRQELDKVKEVAEALDSDDSDEQETLNTSSLVAALSDDLARLDVHDQKSDTVVHNLMPNQPQSATKSRKKKAKGKKGEGDQSPTDNALKDVKRIEQQETKVVEALDATKKPNILVETGTQTQVNGASDSNIIYNFPDVPNLNQSSEHFYITDFDYYDSSSGSFSGEIKLTALQEPKLENAQGSSVDASSKAEVKVLLEVGTQAGVSDIGKYDEMYNFPDILIPHREDENGDAADVEDNDLPVPVHRAEAATNLVRDILPVHIALAASDSGVAIGNIHSPSVSDFGSSSSDSTIGNISCESPALASSSNEEIFLPADGFERLAIVNLDTVSSSEEIAVPENEENENKTD